MCFAKARILLIPDWIEVGAIVRRFLTAVAEKSSSADRLPVTRSVLVAAPCSSPTASFGR